MEMKIELIPMWVPNFVLQKMPPRPRQDGFAEGPKFALAELDAATLAGLCDQFRKDVFAKAGKVDPSNSVLDRSHPSNTVTERQDQTTARSGGERNER